MAAMTIINQVSLTSIVYFTGTRSYLARTPVPVSSLGKWKLERAMNGSASSSGYIRASNAAAGESVRLGGLAGLAGPCGLINCPSPVLRRADVYGGVCVYRGLWLLCDAAWLRSLLAPSSSPYTLHQSLYSSILFPTRILLTMEAAERTKTEVSKAVHLCVLVHG